MIRVKLITISRSSRKNIIILYIVLISIFMSIKLINHDENIFNDVLSEVEKIMSKEDLQNEYVIAAINQYAEEVNYKEEKLILDGSLHIATGNIEEGIETIEQAIELNANKYVQIDVIGNKILADISFNQGQYEEAANYLYKSFNHINKRRYNKYYKEILDMYIYPYYSKVDNKVLIEICTNMLNSMEYDNKARLEVQVALEDIYVRDGNYVKTIESLVKNIYLALNIGDEEVYTSSMEQLNEIDNKISNKEISLKNENYFNFLIEDIEKEVKLKEKLNMSTTIFKILIAVVVISLIIFNCLIIYIRKIKKINKYDPLTKIYNRGYFEKRYYELLNRNNKFSVIMIDIDNFKKLNDTYGHCFGDTVLVNCCAVINNNFSGGFEPFRYGGEEIAIILNNKSKREVVMIAEGIRKIIEDLIWEEEIKVTISLGIAYSEEYGKETLRKADENLYKAKKTGKNKVVCN